MQKSQLSLEVENIPSQNFENACFLTVANKSKLYYGIPPELDLGVVIEEENEEEEDKEKPKVSTSTFLNIEWYLI